MGARTSGQTRTVLIVGVVAAVAVGLAALLLVRAAAKRGEPPAGQPEPVLAVGPPPAVIIEPPVAAGEAVEAGESDAVHLALEPKGTAEAPITVTARFEGSAEDGLLVVLATPKEGFKWNDAAPAPAIEATAPDWLEMLGPLERVESIAPTIAFRAKARMTGRAGGEGMVRVTAYPCRVDGSTCLMVREEYALGLGKRP